MTTKLSCSPATYTVDPSSEPWDPTTPWMPLDALLAQWAAFGGEATTAFATTATSQAFAALAEERAALHHYTTAYKERQRMTRVPSWAELFKEREWAINALSQAAAHWHDVASALERHASECLQDEATQQEIRTLIGQALEQRLRVWTIAQHLLAEQVTSYQQDARTGRHTDGEEAR